MVLFWSLLQISTWSVRHRFAVSSLAWNNSHILTTGALDGKIVNNDVRVRTHIVSTYSGHTHKCAGSSGLSMANNWLVGEAIISSHMG